MKILDAGLATTPADVAASANRFHSINTTANYYRVVVANAGTTSITVEAL